MSMTGSFPFPIQNLDIANEFCPLFEDDVTAVGSLRTICLRKAEACPDFSRKIDIL